MPDPDLRAEYDFSTMAGGVRGRYVERYRAGVNLVLLEPEVAKAFPKDEPVNEALRESGGETSVRDGLRADIPRGHRGSGPQLKGMVVDHSIRLIPGLQSSLMLMADS